MERIELCGITAVPPSREIHKTALGADQTVSWGHWESTAACVEALHGEGYRVLAVEQVEGAVMLDDFAPESDAKYALVFGNEVDGVDQQVVDLCDGALEIPQAGTKHSINVAVSGGVVLWQFFAKSMQSVIFAALKILKTERNVRRKYSSGGDDLPPDGDEAARREDRHADLV